MFRKFFGRLFGLGYWAMLLLLFLSGSGLYLVNYWRSPENPESVQAFNRFRESDPEAARMQFHEAMGPCVQKITGESITGRHKSYLADMFYVLSDPEVSWSIVRGYDEIGKVEEKYRDVLISSSMVPTPQERVFERVQAKMLAGRGDMNFYNCLLEFGRGGAQTADLLSSAASVANHQNMMDGWELLPTANR